MNKQEFLVELRRKLKGLPKSEIDERINFYSEMIDDHIEEGLSEEESVAKIGCTDDISRQIIDEAAVTKPKRKKSAGEIALFWGGSPLWFILAVAVAAVVISLYASLWAVIGSLWGCVVALAASGVFGIVAAVPCAIGGNVTAGLVLFGAALVCIGISIFAYLGCKAATKWALLLTKKATCIKKLFVKKEESR